MKYEIPEVSDIVYNDQTIPLNVLLTREYDDIAEAAVELPGVIEFLNQMLQYYTATEIIEKHQIKKVMAEVYMELRGGTFAIKYSDKMTEAALEHAVNADARVAEAIATHADAEAWVDRLRTTIKVLLTRMEFIRTVEATRRHADISSVR